VVALEVALSKLKKYASQQGGYELIEAGVDFELSFVPSFPEAMEKSYSGVQPRVTMYGKIDRGRVYFEKVEVEDEKGTRLKDMEDAELAYRGWLEYIEENY
jgi:hypothetical protein